MFRPFLLYAAFLVFLVSGCADDDGSNDPFDGNFIVGDASPPDPPAEAGLLDARPGLDAEPNETGLDDADGGAPEVGPLDAEPEDAGPDPCEVEPEEVLTASVAVAQGAGLDGRVIEVRGRLETGPPQCTERACGVEDPCCNACSASLAIDGVLLVGPSECIENVGCTGDDCGLVCRPAALGAEEVFIGRILHDATLGSTLLLIRVERP